VVREGETVAQRHLNNLANLLQRATKEVQARTEEHLRVEGEALRTQIEEVSRGPSRRSSPPWTPRRRRSGACKRSSRASWTSWRSSSS